MVDTVTTNILNDGKRNVVVALTNVSDGTGESEVTKIDVSTLEDAPDEISIEKIRYATQGMAVNLFWDATADVLAWTIPPDSEGEICFQSIGGLKNNAGAGKTGDVKLSTVGATAGDSYSIVIEAKKNA